jgi:hypothetical protein
MLRICRYVLAGSSFALVLCAAGCRKPGGAAHYEIFGGTVETLRADTFDLTIRPGDRWADRVRSPAVSCLLTKNTEIYINDRFSRFDAIAIGDGVELIGYFEEAAAGEQRFVVSFAYITRNEPLPPAPDLSRSATQPEPQQQES